MASAPLVIENNQPISGTLFLETSYSTMTAPTTLHNSLTSQERWDTNAVTSMLLHNTSDYVNSSVASSDPSSQLNKYFIYQVAYFLNRYYLWVVLAFGFPGNIVSFITILKMKPVTSPTVYVAAVAFVDNTCLACKVLFFTLTKYDAHIGDAGCAVILFLGSFTAQFANWLLVAMTVERCLAICLPLRVGTICTRKLHIMAIVITALILIGLNSHTVMTSEMTNKAGDYECHQSNTYEPFFNVWHWVDAAVYAILPALLLVIMNTLIILGIRRSGKIQRELTNKATQVAETMRQQRQITIMLVVVCIAYVLLITPLALFYAIKYHWKYEKYSYEHAKYLFTNQLAFVLADSTHAVNFYLYFFSTRRFRKRCLETVFYWCMPRRRGRGFRGLTVSGASKTFRLSITDVTTVPPNTVQLTNFSSSSSSSSNHLHLANGDTKMTRMKSSNDGSL